MCIVSKDEPEGEGASLSESLKFVTRQDKGRTQRKGYPAG